MWWEAFDFSSVKVPWKANEQYKGKAHGKQTMQCQMETARES